MTTTNAKLELNWENLLTEAANKSGKILVADILFQNAGVGRTLLSAKGWDRQVSRRSIAINGFQVNGGGQECPRPHTCRRNFCWRKKNRCKRS